MIECTCPYEIVEVLYGNMDPEPLRVGNEPECPVHEEGAPPMSEACS